MREAAVSKRNRTIAIKFKALDSAKLSLDKISSCGCKGHPPEWVLNLNLNFEHSQVNSCGELCPMLIFFFFLHVQVYILISNIFMLVYVRPSTRR